MHLQPSRAPPYGLPHLPFLPYSPMTVPPPPLCLKGLLRASKRSEVVRRARNCRPRETVEPRLADPPDVAKHIPDGVAMPLQPLPLYLSQENWKCPPRFQSSTRPMGRCRSSSYEKRLMSSS